MTPRKNRICAKNHHLSFCKIGQRREQKMNNFGKILNINSQIDVQISLRSPYGSLIFQHHPASQNLTPSF